MNESKMRNMPDIPDSTSNFLFVALIVPDPERRRKLAGAIAGYRNAIVRDLGDHPRPGDPSDFARLGCDVAIVDLDSDPQQAVRTIENVCGHNPSTTVMAYSGRSDVALARRAMQAGARDFLSEPLPPEMLKDAFDRISSRRTLVEKNPGKLMLFVPAKAGVGVTSIASNFAVALTQETSARVVLIDMDLQLGDVAVGLGVSASCSVADALRNPTRLDRDFLSTLLVRHPSGLDILAAPDDYDFSSSAAGEGAARLFQVLQEEFDYVVVDGGTFNGPIQESLSAKADKLYLVIELSFPALRNAHRMVSYLSARGGANHLEVVLNRFDAASGDIDELHAQKAIGRGIEWRIPDGGEAARKDRDSGKALAMRQTPISAALTQMARAACGKPPTVGKPRGKFHLPSLKALLQFSETPASPQPGTPR